MIATFDIADGGFEFYTDRQWNTRIQQWRALLLDDGYEFAEDMDAEEIVEAMYGNELMFDVVPDFSSTDSKQYLT